MLVGSSTVTELEVMREKPIAFMSYAHDADSDGRITYLREALEREVKLEIGEIFPIFQDRKDIIWGESWRKRIEHSIDAVTFFIPVITPSFFSSTACCLEVEKFHDREQTLGFDDLILPIKYVEFNDIHIQSTNHRIKEILLSHQMEDWQDIRTSDLNSEVVRRKIVSMAKSIKTSYTKKFRSACITPAETASAKSNTAEGTRSKPPDTLTSAKAVIFSHYSMPRDEIRWESFRRNPPDYIDTKWGDQLEAFDVCPSVKLAFIFFSHAYTERIKGDSDLDRFRSEEVHLILRMKEYIRDRRFNEEKYVFIGYDELESLLNEIDPLAKNSKVDLKDLLLGGNGQLFYDAPKIIEALIRIARRETNEPIIRVDEDVTVNEGALVQLIATWQTCVFSRRPYFFFSGNYTWHDRRDDPEKHFLNDYSVLLHFLSVAKNGRSFVDSAQTDVFRLDIRQIDEFLADLKILGYDVYEQPISGAGLCISHTAIEQLPPFANLTRNVTWIDDGIKRALHEGIDDLSPYEDIRIVPSARFRQERLRGQEELRWGDVRWALFEYLPRLFHGLLISNLMYNNRSCGSYAHAIKQYMLERETPGRDAFRQWAKDCERTVQRMYGLFTSKKYSNVGGQGLSDICRECLSLNTYGMSDSIIVAISEENITEAARKIQEMAEGLNGLAKKCGFDAGILIAQSVLELRRYFDLLEFWPFLTRTIVFMMRSRGAVSHLLGRDTDSAPRHARYAEKS